MACDNPQLAEQCRHKRQELLAATEAQLKVLAASMTRPGGPRETAAEIGVRAGKIINHYKMAKHFTLTIRDGGLEWARKGDAIQKEKLLDGINQHRGVRTRAEGDSGSASNKLRQHEGRSRRHRASGNLGERVSVVGPTRAKRLRSRDWETGKDFVGKNMC